MNLRKVIALAAYRRPGYTQGVLESLVQCYGIEDYTLLISCDYAPEYYNACDEVIEICKKFQACEKIIYINNPRFGIHANRLFLGHRSYQITDYVIGIEDDTPLAKDALRFFEYIGYKFGSDHNFISATGYNRYTELITHENNMREYKYTVDKINGFYGWGWSMFKSFFEQFVDGKWPCEDGMDWWIRNIMKNNSNLYSIYPIVPRANHVGWENSEHTQSQEWLMENEFNLYGAWSQEMPDPPRDIWNLI